MKELLNEPFLWLAIIVVLGLLIALALWVGRGLKVRADKSGVNIEVTERQQPKPHQQETVVADHSKITESEVGNIIGEKTPAEDKAETSPKKVSVAEGAVIGKSKVGDIVGVDKSGQRNGQRNGKRSGKKG